MAKYCKYCGKSLKDGESCNCQAIRNAKAGAISGGSELKYTNTVKKQILMIYILSVIIGIIVGIAVFCIAGDFWGNERYINILICVLFVYIALSIARNLVARLGMQMEMSYNLNEIRKILRDVPYSLNEIANYVEEIKAFKENDSDDADASDE